MKTEAAKSKRKAPSGAEGIEAVPAAKIQPPSLRAETLERTRLLDWLRAKSTGRVVLVLADAGYGKTTLLADFSRRTRQRTIWYRMDRRDGDLQTLVRHVIAGCRRYEADFGSRTEALSKSMEPDDSWRHELVEVLASELGDFARDGAVLILDDFHEVDDTPDARLFLRGLIGQAPDGLCVVVASRHAPSISLARLRASGELNQLGTADLRFDEAETADLFNVSGQALDPDSVAALAAKTEGWAASLQMVQAALRDRTTSETRRFIRDLNGADPELYDHLAEAVVSELAEDLQQFLMSTAVLEEVTPHLAEVVTGFDEAAVMRMLTTADRLTLLSRSGTNARNGRRYHPLVRQFLRSRYANAYGEAAARGLHLAVARDVRESDWRAAAFHYRAAGDVRQLHDVVSAAIPTIMGTGEYDLAETYLREGARISNRPAFDVIQSRVDMQQGDYERAIAASTAALAAAPTADVERDHALLNLVTLYLNFGDGDLAVEFAEKLLKSSDPNLAMIAEASIAMVAGSEDGDVERIGRLLGSMAKAQQGVRPHHYAVTLYNLAANMIVQDRPTHALAELDSALAVLDSGSAGIERAAAIAVKAQALAMLGRSREAEQAIADIRHGASNHLEPEVMIGIADLYDSYLSPSRASRVFAEVDLQTVATPSGRRLAALALARMHVRAGRFDEAHAALGAYGLGRPVHLGIEAARRATEAYLAVAAREFNASELASRAIDFARGQGAHRWRRCSELLLGLTQEAQLASTHIALIGAESPHSLSWVAELICARLHELDESALQAVEVAAAMHPGRWRPPLRGAVDRREPAALAAGLVVESIGEKEDIARLRALAADLRKEPEAADLGRKLARRLADPVYVEDLGPVRLRIGARNVAGTQVRRKVLALACFLLSRPKLSSTRDQVLEALWPDLAPEVAANSLNQTLYFLRRVFEERYREDLSPGFVHHDSDVIWLDHELVRSRSNECRELVRNLPKNPRPDEVDRLMGLYEGRFALDFEYEEWAAEHRDWLHAAYLEIVERAIRDDFHQGHHDRAIRVARQALEVDSTAENIELSLLRLYRVTGAHSAAAEQYAHYAAAIRNDLGIEAPPLESL